MIAEFMQAYERAYAKRLSRSSAAEVARRLLQLCWLIRQGRKPPVRSQPGATSMSIRS